MEDVDATAQHPFYNTNKVLRNTAVNPAFKTKYKIPKPEEYPVKKLSIVLNCNNNARDKFREDQLNNNAVKKGGKKGEKKDEKKKEKMKQMTK